MILPLLKDATLCGENLENCYPCLIKKKFLYTQMNKCITCFRRTLLYSSECWLHRHEDKKCLEHSETAMLLWMCNIKKEQHVSTNSLISWLKLKGLDSVLGCKRLCWFDNVKQRQLYTEQILDLQVEGNRSSGRPNKCWPDTIKDDLGQWNLQDETCQNRSEWGKQLKTASHRHAGSVMWH